MNPTTQATTPPAAADLMAHLRDSTREAHQHAEQRAFNRGLVRGTLPRSVWVTHLEQHRLLHQALDARLAHAASGKLEWSTLIAGRSRVLDLESDLHFWGGSLAPRPLLATAVAVDRIANAGSDETLGMLYVLEGSTNGGRFLVRSARRAFALAEETTAGIRSLDPYGDQQPARWASFKTTMNGLHPAPSVAAVSAGALAMFGMVGSIADEIWNPA